MSQRTMILAALLAALVLVVLGGAVAHLTRPAAPELAQAGPPEAAPSESAPEPPAAADPGDRADGRDAEYRRLIAEANRRLSAQQRALDEARRRARDAEARSAAVRPVASTGWRGADDHERFEQDDDGYEDDDHERYEHHPRRGERWEHDDD